MIEVNDVLRAVPHFETFCSVKKLHDLVGQVRADPRFEVKVAGTSGNGVPIHHVRFGSGSIKALVVGGPHAMEPIGSLTVFSLMHLLQQSHPGLESADVEWHIVPCADPDGALLNEGWTQQPFSIESYIRNFYVQPRAEQIDFSFPIHHKKLIFDRPSKEAKVLRDIISQVRPDFYFSLHNCSAMGGSWYFLSRDIGEKCYRDIYLLMDQHGVSLQRETVMGLEQYAPGMRDTPTVGSYYDHLERLGVAIPAEYLTGALGAASNEYVLEVQPKALVFGAELTYGQHSGECSDRQTGQTLRQLNLRVFADNKFLAATILEEWGKVQADLNVASPFYRKIDSELITRKASLHEGLTHWYEQPVQSLLFNEPLGRIATECDRIQTYLYKSFFLGNAYAFVRLLKASSQTAAVRAAIERLDALFTEAIDEMKRHIGFADFAVTDCDRLARVQLGSGLIALNSLLEAPAR